MNQPARTTKSLDWQLIKRLFIYVFPYRLWLSIALILLIVAKLIEAFVPVKVGFLTQFILNQKGQAAFHIVSLQLAWLLGWVGVGYLFETLNIWLKNWLGQKALLQLRLQVYDHILHLPLGVYERYPIGKLMTRTIDDIEQISQLFSESLIPLLGSLFLFVGIFVGLFFINWEIALLFCGLLPLLVGLTHHFRTKQRRSYSAIRSAIAAMNTFVQEHLMGVAIIRSFGLYHKERQRFETLNQEHLEANLETVQHYAFFFAGIEFLQNLTLIAVFVLLMVLVPRDGFQAGTFFTISIYSLMIFRPLLDLAERYNVLQSAMAAAERIFEILDTPIESKGAEPGLALQEVETIVFEHVWFAYEGENWVLQDLSFTVGKGEAVALVGATGSGKTSITSLLLRLYDFQKGEIWINGESIRAFSVAALRRQFSVILQDPVLFSGTIEENIALYDAAISQQEVQTSASYVNLNPIVERFPEGFSHVLSERGAGLSAGEMQLIALARAVAHRRSVLIFDEATSNIDLQTEAIIQATLKKMLSGKTALVVAHRLSTIKDVDRILVLHQGRLVETGTHQQLLAAQGVYEKLYRLQFVAIGRGV